MKIQIVKDAADKLLTFAEVPVGSFYTMDGALYYKISEKQYLEMPSLSGKINCEVMNGVGARARILVPAGTQIVITV